jgi:hypothetical protein
MSSLVNGYVFIHACSVITPPVLNLNERRPTGLCLCFRAGVTLLMLCAKKVERVSVQLITEKKKQRV